MKNSSLLTSVLVVIVGNLHAYTITYDHQARQFSCEQSVDCTASVPVGKIVTVLIKNSVPDLMSAQVEVIEVPPSRDTSAAIRSFLNPGSAATPPPPKALPGAASKTTKQAWEDLPSAIEKVRRAVPADLRSYPATISQVKEDVDSLIKDLGISDDAQFVDKLKAAAAAAAAAGVVADQFTIGMADAQVTTFWQSAHKLAAASSTLSDFGPVSYRPASDFTVTITFTGKSDLVPVAGTQTLSMVASTSVSITTATGLGYSGLVDDHYTSVTITDTPASGTTPAVTHREGRLEQRDAGFPEAVLLIHITGASDSGYFSNSWYPRGITFGGGVSTGISGRIYAGATWNIGRVAFATAGIAGGRVKRLSASANLKNLGDVDPEATRRDVFKTSYFAGVTIRLPSP